jgi:hypothetical protein
MKKRVRIYKAGGEQGMVTNPLSKWMMQMGSVPQAQPSDEELFTFVMNGLSEEVPPEDLYQQLVSQNIDPNKADQIVSVAVERLEEEQSLNQSIQTEDPASAEMLEAENLKQQEVAEEMARRQRMQALYADDYETGQEEYMGAEDEMLMQTGGVPTKKAFIKNVMNLVKKEKGGITNTDSTDDGSREKLNNAFVNSLKSTAEEARIKKEAESLYDNVFSQETSKINKQEGGFVNPFDEEYGDPNLYKFIYGGNEFEQGGSLQQYQAQGQVNDNTRVELIDKKTNKVVGYTTMKEAEGNPKYAGFAHRVASQTNNKNTSNTNQQTQNQRQQYYDNFMNPYGGYGRIYPPLFGARRFIPYGTPAIQYAGSWMQQRGLPYDPRTGKPFGTSGYGQLPLSRIDVKGRKATYTFGQPTQPGQPATYKKDGYSGVILPSAGSSQQTTEQTSNENLGRVKGQGLWRYPKISEYETTPLENVTYDYKDKADQNIYSDEERIKGKSRWRYPKIGEYETTPMETSIRMEPSDFFKSNVVKELQYPRSDANSWYADQQRAARQEFDLLNRQYGGIPYAQSGMEQDEVIRMNTLRPQDVLQPGITSETQDVLNPFAGEQYAVDTKRKDMYTVDFPQMLNKFNTGAYKALDFFGGLGDYGNQLQQYANLTSDNVYTPNYGQDDGNYDPNSGLFRPGRMGQLQYSQMGGNIDDEVEMTEEEIEAFLANGGQLEYL